MWKIIVGFIAFAALAMFVIIKGGNKVDMSGEKHETGESHAAPTASAPAAAGPASSAASGASAAK
jgi:hypothetical protein